jgi:hypothetical protein
MPILGIMASSRPAFELVGSYDSLATVTVPSGGVASITFAGIPTGYKHLQIRGIGRTSFNNGSDGAGMIIRFNGVTTNAYAYHNLIGNGSAASAQGYASQTEPQPAYVSAAGQLASAFGASVIDVLDYANTNKNKTVRVLSGMEVNASISVITLGSSLWNNTNAITSVELKCGAGNFVEYSSFALYGVK